MSAATSSPAGATAGSPIAAPPSLPAGEACPLCATPLHPEQEWCLSCGAAARTRVAASPNWKAPLVSAVVVIVLSLGVLAGALVKLAGETGPAPPLKTQTVTTAPAAIAPAPTPTTPTPTPTTPTATTPIAPAQTAPQATTPGTNRGTLGTGSAPPGVSAKTLERLRKLGLLPKK